MEIQALKIFNSIKLILFLILVLGVITILTACGDLVKESDTGACNSAIDARNYETALSVCTSRKDKASAYMGMAGYDIINLLKSSGTSVSMYTEPTALGTDDVAGASILNILQLSVDVIADKDTRAAAISSSKSNLDSAYKLLQPYLNDNSSPLTKDEILLNTFAISFAMQLDQIILFDNKTTSTSTVPLLDSDSGDLKCTQVSGYNDDSAKALLIAKDGHIWAAERDRMQCTRVLNAYNDAPNKTAAATALDGWVDATEDGDNETLPDPYYDAVCPSFEFLTEYLVYLALNLTELGETVSLSGDNTKVITNAQTSTDTLIKTIGCFK